MYDTNMETARLWADKLGPIPILPSSLQNVEQRAKLVEAINGPLIRNSDLERLSNIEIYQRLDAIAKKSVNYITDIQHYYIRVNISLRLWSGCLSAAKMIAFETRSGENKPEIRELTFTNRIDPIAERDLIYRAGVEAAPAFKKLVGQPYSFEGVPQNSSVRKYP